MANYFYPAAYGLFVWWFSTGLIIFLDNLPPRTFRWSMLGGTAVLVMALARLAASSHVATPAGAYAAFTYAVLIWGWQEMSFFMGVITGPRRHGCPRGCGGWRHFLHGIEACLYHELAIIATAVVVVWLTRGAPNQVGTWTFMLLWGMRQSAKLNFFLGVRNLSEEFLPAHLSFLKSFLRRRPMNALMPFSIAGGTGLTFWLVQRAMAPGITAFHATGLTFLITMLALAVIEHWFLVLPLPFARIWHWALRTGRPAPTNAPEPHGEPESACAGHGRELRVRPATAIA
jgi:putative photosynthetic complex assembly protein 2